MPLDEVCGPRVGWGGHGGDGDGGDGGDGTSFKNGDTETTEGRICAGFLGDRQPGTARLVRRPVIGNSSAIWDLAALEFPITGLLTRASRGRSRSNVSTLAWSLRVSVSPFLKLVP